MSGLCSVFNTFAPHIFSIVASLHLCPLDFFKCRVTYKGSAPPLLSLCIWNNWPCSLLFGHHYIWLSDLTIMTQVVLVVVVVWFPLTLLLSHDVGLILIKLGEGIILRDLAFDLIWFVGNNAGWYAYWKSLSVIMSSRTRKGCNIKRSANHHSGTLRLTFLLNTMQCGCFETVLRIMSETKTKNGAKGIVSYCNVLPTWVLKGFDGRISCRVNICTLWDDALEATDIRPRHHYTYLCKSDKSDHYTYLCKSDARL